MALPSTIYNLLPAQEEFLHVPSPGVNLDISLYQGGFGSGKTFSGVIRGLLLCQKYPGIRGLACAKTYPLLRDTTLQTYFEVFDDLHFRDGREFVWKASESKLIFPKWGNSVILFRHLEKPYKLKSLNLGWVHIEEMSEVEESIFMMLISRLRQKGIPRHYLFGTTNPQAIKGYIHRVFVEKNKSKDSILYRRVLAPTTQNKYLPAEYLENMSQQFDPEYYRINVMGEDGDYTAGLVCKNWSSLANVQDVPYCDDQRIYLTCDFNVDPMCWALAHRRNGEYHFFDEIVLENTNIISTVREFVRRYGQHKAGIIITGDSSGNTRTDGTPDPNQTRYDLLLKTLSDYGVTNFALDAPRANPLVESRIEVWNSFICNQKGERRVKVGHGCHQIQHVCENLRYIPGSSVIWQPTPKQIEQDNKMKFLRQDMFDAISYLVNHYDPKIQRVDQKKPAVRTAQFRPGR